MTHTAAKPNAPRTAWGTSAPSIVGRDVRSAFPGDSSNPLVPRIVSGAFCCPPATGTGFRNLTRLQEAAAPLSGDSGRVTLPFSPGWRFSAPVASQRFNLFLTYGR
jgi:hypothetical protein